MKHKKDFQNACLFLLVWIACSLSIQTKAQLWGLPCGSSLGGSYAFLTTATTVGEGVYIPLDYLNSSIRSRYYVMYESTEPLTVIKGKTFEINLIAKNGGEESQTSIVPDLRTTCAFIYSDWNQDGFFEDIAQIGNAAASTTPQGNMEVLNIKQTISVPADAKTGKTRLRVRYTKPKNGSIEVGAMHDITSGLLFDIAVYVIDYKNENDYKIIVKSSSQLSGTAKIITAPKLNGRFEKGSKVSLQAEVTDSEQNFISWSIGDKVISTDPYYEFIASESKMLVANFSSPLPDLSLSAPVPSTENEPIWFQIMNAQTDARKDMCISNDGSVFKCLKPADGSSPFLWRMEKIEDNKVKFISKKDGRCMSVSGSNVVLTSSTDVGEFVVTPSGNRNGSYSIKFDNDETKLLNCDGSTNQILIYNGGIGTGSGWYFYKATFNPSSSVENNENGSMHVSMNSHLMKIRGATVGSLVRIFSISGNCMQTFRLHDNNYTFPFSHPKGYYLTEIQSPEGNRHTFKTIH